MKYTQQELQHFEWLANFFNYELHIDGEYPFYTDDRLIEVDAKVMKNLYKDGKRTSVNMFPASTQTDAGVHMLNRQIYENYLSGLAKQYHNPFFTFVVKNWSELLTEKQQQFIIDVINGNEDQYTKQQKHQYRSFIQKRLKTAFVGEGGKDVAHYKIGDYKSMLRIVDALLTHRMDNKGYLAELVKNIDKGYINELVYGRLTAKARQEIVNVVLKKSDTVSPQTLYEAHHLILIDKNMLSSRGIV